MTWLTVLCHGARVLCAATVAGLLGAAPAGAEQITVSTAGDHPNVLVDRIGTAHVVWNEPTPFPLPDVLHYCRIPRGAAACEAEQTFVPPETPESGNKNAGGPRIVQTSADEIVIITHRYPAVVVSTVEGEPSPRCFEEHPRDPGACYGSSHNSTWAYSSTDGGDSFAVPELLGVGRLSGPPIALTAGFDAPRIAMVSDTETGGTYFQAVGPDGWSKEVANLGEEDGNRAGSGSVAAFRDETPVVAFNDLNSRVFVRGYRGGPMNAVSSWHPPAPVDVGTPDGYPEPRLAGGPRGLWLLYGTGTPEGRQYMIKRVLDATGRTSSTATPVSDAGSVYGRDFFQDAGGNLHAAWVRRGVAGDELRHRMLPELTLTGGTVETLFAADTGRVNGVDIAAAEDGGGVAVFNSASDGAGVVTAVTFGPQTPLVDVRVTGIEVTQAVQGLFLPERDSRHVTAAVPYQGALLQARARTVVRVYASSRGAWRAGTSVPAMRLRICVPSGASNCLTLPPEFSPATLRSGGGATVPSASRLDARAAYTFTLPWHVAIRTQSLIAEVNPEGLEPALGECRRCRDDNRFELTGIAYRETAIAIIHPIPLRIRGQLPAGYPLPDPVFAALLATSPLRVDVQPYTSIYDATYIEDDTELDNPEKNAEAREIVEDWSEDFTDELSSRFPIGITPASSAIKGQTNGDGELYGDQQPQAVANAGRPLTAVAHEFVHGLGHDHAGQDCDGTRPGNDQVGESWPPDQRGLMDGYGLDLRGEAPYRVIGSGMPRGPAEAFDYMSYCVGSNEGAAWVSLRTWNRVVAFRAPPQRAARRAATVDRPSRAAATLRAVAFLTDGQARVSSVAPDDNAATPLDPAAPLVLVARDAAGREVARAGVEVDEPADGTAVRLEGRVAAPAAASVTFEQAGVGLATRSRSPAAPRVTYVSPRPADGPLGRRAEVTVRWRATDADGDRLLATVEYSADGGRTWRPVAFGASRGSVTLPRRLLYASGNARLRVRVGDGFSEAVATSGRLRSRGDVPEVRVLTPSGGTALDAGAPLLLEGRGYDDAGKRLAGARLRWLEGRRVLGRGEQVVATGLLAGRHTIVLEARDSRGRLATRSIVVRVRPVRPLFTVLQAPARISRTARSVTLRVAATVPAVLTVRGRRIEVGTAARRVTISVLPGRAPVRLSLRLRAGGPTVQTTVVVSRR